MKRFLVSFLLSALLTGMCLAQAATQSQASGTAATSASADKSGVQAKSDTSATASQETKVAGKGNQATAAGQLQAGSTIRAELLKPVDARKSKPGDAVTAKATQDVKSAGRVVIPKGSRIMGHVTEVKARAKGQSESTMGIVFDRAILKDGSEMPLALTIQAVGSGAVNAAAEAADEPAAPGQGASGGPPSYGRANAGIMGGVQSTAGSVVNTAGSAAGTTLHTAGSASGSVAGPLSSASHGAVGLPGLTLSSDAANSSKASVISSKTTNVHLDSGTELVLSVNSR